MCALVRGVMREKKGGKDLVRRDDILLQLRGFINNNNNNENKRIMQEGDLPGGTVEELLLAVDSVSQMKRRRT